MRTVHCLSDVKRVRLQGHMTFLPSPWYFKDMIYNNLIISRLEVDLNSCSLLNSFPTLCAFVTVFHIHTHTGVFIKAKGIRVTRVQSNFVQRRDSRWFLLCKVAQNTEWFISLYRNTISSNQCFDVFDVFQPFWSISKHISYDIWMYSQYTEITMNFNYITASKYLFFIPKGCIRVR